MSKLFYFFVYYPRTQKETENDIDFVVPKEVEQRPECIYSVETYSNGIHYYKKIYKVNKAETKGKKANYYEFEIGEEKYIISFNSKDFVFIYDVNLEFGKKIIQIRRNIDQTNIEYHEKLEYFIEALKSNREEEKIDKLYEDSISLFLDKKGFSFMISLFLKVYKKEKLCKVLMEKFKEMNGNPKENDKNLDRKDYLKDYTSKFIDIVSEAEQLKSDYNYEPIDFYGVIVCFLNYYDYKNYSSIEDKLFCEKKEVLFDILIIYNKHILNKINQNLDFLNKFIGHAINYKKFDTLKTAINYIKDIETFVAVLEEKKKDIFETYIKPDNDSKKNEKYIIELKNLKFKKKEISQVDIKEPKDEVKKVKDDKKDQTEAKKVTSDKDKDDKKGSDDDDDDDEKPKKCTLTVTTIGDVKGNKSQIIDKNLSEKDKGDSTKTENREQNKKNIISNTKKKKEEELILKIISNIKKIIEFCDINKIFFIHFTNDFWKYILYCYKEPTQINIKICFEIREAFIKYYNLVIEIFKKKKKFNIKNDAIICFENDEFAFLLDDIIKRYIDSNKTLTNIEKLDFIKIYNPYYIENIEDKFSDKVDSDIFNSFNLNEIDDLTIKDFRKMKFEKIFKGKIGDFIREFISKIKSINNFLAVIKLINLKRIKKFDNKGIKRFLDSLNKKYDDILQKEIEAGIDLKREVKVFAELAILYYTYDEKDKKLDFVKNDLQKLPKKIIPLVYIETIKIYIEKIEKIRKIKDGEIKENELIDEDDKEEIVDFKDLKNYIFDEFVKKIESNDNIDNIIKLIDCIEGKQNVKDSNEQTEENNKKKNERVDILNEFLKKLIEKNLFTKEEFFSSKPNIKISLLSALYEKGKIKPNDEEYYEKIIKLLQEIRGDIEGKIKKKKLEEFLKVNESLIHKRLSLIKLILEGFNPEKEYNNLKKKFEKINDDIKNLEFIRDNIIIYFNETYQELLKKLIEVINNNENKEIKNFKEGRIKALLEECEKLQKTAEKINNVKNFLLFQVIYEKNAGIDEYKNFNTCWVKLEEIRKSFENNKDATKIYETYKEIFDKIREKITNNVDKAQQFIEDLKIYFKINDEKLIDKLTILFKSKKYEKDINSIIFFFSYFEKDNKKWNEILSEKKYKDLSNYSFEDILKKLKELEDNEIYNYKEIKKYNELFTCLFEKNEALEFLIEKIGQNIDDLKDRIQPSDKRIKIQNVIETEKCIYHMTQMKKMNDNFKIFSYIKHNLDKNAIEQFVSYSKNYETIIELDRYYDSSENFYKDVNDIIKENFTINISQDSQSFFYTNEKGESKDILMEDLIKLKNKLHNINENESKKEKSEESKSSVSDQTEQKDDVKDKMKLKRKTLLFFKKIISNIELIVKEYMNALRTKGSSIPIKICIKVKKDDIKYYLGEELLYFEKKNSKEKDGIKDFLIKAKNKYTSLLNSEYKQKMNLRFMYGKQFRSMMKHLETGYKIDSFLRYILNNTDNNKNVKEGFRAVDRTVNDWIHHNEIYEEDSFKNISTYIQSLFEYNDKKLEEHYLQMIINPKDKYKGIYLYECDSNSMEEFIIKLFWDKLTLLPMAQNVLITSKETSEEEMQAFFHRAILCNYNTLFVVEINDSFSEQQQGIMNTYIDQLLSYKNKEEKYDKSETQDYLDSCILFIYGKEYKNNITSLLKELKKLKNQQFEIHDVYQAANKNKENFLTELGNIKIFTSEICGLGKTGKIKKLVKDNHKKLVHFPLGGILTKQIIFEKLQNLLNLIKNDNYKDVAIHLDLTESREKSIMNEFLFSFLITKFYTNNENIIYIPKDIHIYIEIPNCFEDYLSKFNLLKIFSRDNIIFDKMPEYNFSLEIINIFKRMLDIDSNTKIKEFVDEYIGIKKYSYHQINIFIKLFISQYNKFKSKLKFYDGDEDVTKKCIKEFAKCTQYFTNGGFSKLLTGIVKINKNDPIDQLSEIYDNDLGNMKFPAPLIFIIKEKMIYDKFIVHEKESKIYKYLNDYLIKIEELLKYDKNSKDYKQKLEGILEYKNSQDLFKKIKELAQNDKNNIDINKEDINKKIDELLKFDIKSDEYKKNLDYILQDKDSNEFFLGIRKILLYKNLEDYIQIIKELLQYKYKFLNKIEELLEIKNYFKDIKKNIEFKKNIIKNKEKNKESENYKQKIEDLFKYDQKSEDYKQRLKEILKSITDKYKQNFEESLEYDTKSQEYNTKMDQLLLIKSQSYKKKIESLLKYEKNTESYERRFNGILKSITEVIITNKTKDYLIELEQLLNYNDSEIYLKKLIGILDSDRDSNEYLQKIKELLSFKDSMNFLKKIKEILQYGKSSKEYLRRMKEILNIKNKVGKDDGNLKSLLSIIEKDNYVITDDNFKKMVLLVYRIKANVPVIIMGETGCGKTALITKLNQILNNGKTTVEIINIHPGIDDTQLCKIMDEKNIIAKKNSDEELWLFFDEINTCLSLSLITEIFINRTYSGKKISENIRLIGACNPYRKRKGNKEKCGLSFSDDNDNEFVYLVEPLPQSLLYYVFSFGSIDDEDEKKYIYSIIENLFTKEEKNIHEITKEAISKCHVYLRNIYDSSVVSLREIARFSKCVEFFMEYFTKKNKFEDRPNNIKNNKIRSIICSIFLCYYIRLTESKIRTNFDVNLRPILLQLINNKKIEEKGGNILDQIINEEFKKEILSRPEEKIGINFSDFIKVEEDYLINQIELEKGIGKNTLLKENVFLSFVSVVTNIPLIIIGKPGCGKSLSAQLIKNSMRGKYSNKKFFKLFPRIIQTYFQGADTTIPEDVENLFKKANDKLKYYKDHPNLEKPISLALFDELGLAERSKSNPLKVLHSKLEYSGKDKDVGFIGISNYSLDAAKVNRALVLTVPDLDKQLDELIETSRNIVESISPRLQNHIIFEILSNTYFQYKQQLQIIKELIVYKKYATEYYSNTIVNQTEQADNQTKNTLENLKTENGKIKTTIAVQTQENNDLEFNIENNTIYSERKSEEKVSNNDTDNLDEKKNKEKREFESIKATKEFKKMLQKENKIRKDFQGNRDFYNLIRGIANDFAKLGDTTDNKEKIEIIIKYIERNFGGIEYDIDIDYNLKLGDMENQIKTIINILSEYKSYKPNKPCKVSSVFLMKKLYNLSCEKKSSINLQIDKSKINDYNINNCIKENINDTNGRYLLMEIKKTLTPLIHQNIKLQNPFKKIVLYDGSPFGEDNNKEYRYNIINQIQNDAKEEKIILIENLDQIHAFLFDLYNMNYQIIEDKKYARICLDNFDEQLTEVNSKFRIIILVEKKFVNNCGLAFLNRLEKMIVSFDKLLDKNLETKAKNLIQEINLKTRVEKYPYSDIKYLLKDLLINCGDDEIQGLVYNFFYLYTESNNDNDNDDQKTENLDEEKLKENVIDKIYRILPQDILAILPKNNIIKKKYLESENYYNFKDYMSKEDIKKYKISIIYTFTSISNKVEGLNNDVSFNISEIKSEKGFQVKLDEIKNRNENNELKKEDYICIHFEQYNSKKIKFISNLILKTNEEKKYNYILIVHINRNFTEKSEKIYSLPNINTDINQVFIDSLESDNKITLKDILSKDFKEILENKKEELKLDEEFYKTLKIFLNKEIEENKGLDIIEKKEYIKGIINYIKDNESIKDKIFSLAFKLIDENKDDENCNDIIDKIYKDQRINKFTVDIVSCIIEYIKEEIFNKYLRIIFKILEDNNILTTLSDIYLNNFQDIDKYTIENIMLDILDKIKYNKNHTYSCKFYYNFKIPGFYNFFVNLSNYINKNITSNYFANEKKLRLLLKKNIELIRDFYDKEDEQLSKVYDEIKKNYKFEFEMINKISGDLIFKDYITYYLKKHKSSYEIYNKDDIYHKIIELLLRLRFNKQNRIILNNNRINVLLIKIIWIESNLNYILNIFKIVENALIIFGYYENENKSKDNKLLKSIEELINEDKIKYITNDNKNPLHTKEVNECFYILLASICYSITSEEIKLIDIYENKKENEIQIEINDYCQKLKEINKILQNLNDDLYIYLNEMYIIDELIKIIEIFKKDKSENKINKINEIKNNIRENAEIIQTYALSKDQFKLSVELIEKFEKLYNLINIEDEYKDIDYYNKIRYIFFKEIKKVPDIDYRCKILEKLIMETALIKQSNDLFQILLRKYLAINKFKDCRKSILNGEDNVLKHIEKNLSNNLVLEETIIYLYEKNSLIYFQNILNSKKDKEKDKVNFDDEPLEILIDCIDSLDNYYNKTEKKKSLPKMKEQSKLFCLSYIKTYISQFIKMFKDKNPKWNDSQKIIDIINGDNNICKMIRIYIYKILYYKFKVDFFFDEENIKEYKLEEYKDYNEFIQLEELSNLYQIDYNIKTLKDTYFKDAHTAIEKFKKDNFKKINLNNYDLDEYGIDNFFIETINTILLNTQLKNLNLITNIFNNLCKPLFKDKKKLMKAIELFYDPQKNQDIKTKYKINSNNNMPFLIGYRYCLNILFYENENGIYYSLYDIDKINYLKDKFYPGNDTKDNLIYSDIVNHFKTKPEEGCYVCLCKGWYYHSVPSGFPGKAELGKVCPKCDKNIGSEGKFFGFDNRIVKRDGYYRIFKNDEEIEELKGNKEMRKKLSEINYMTIEKLKNNYINKEEKGITSSDEKRFKNDKKSIRNLDQVSYRLLNYILYSNLFFAKLILNKTEFDAYLPKKMSWEETLSECWNILKNELFKEDIDSIEEFMNYIFADLFVILNNSNILDNYEDLIKLEKKLKEKVDELIYKFKNEKNKDNSKQNKNEEEYKSPINILKEKFTYEYYQNDENKEYPFYKYFYYTDYLNEKYISDKLSHMDESQYPLLKLYLDNKNNNDTSEDNKYSPDSLLLFCDTLNLINNTYFNNISQDQAKKKKLKEEEIYMKNKDIIDKFIKFYNSLEMDGNQLSTDNHICDFLVDDTNNFGKSYKKIYQNFVLQYNETTEKLLNAKIEKGIFDPNSKTKINIQQINDKEILTLNLPRNISFIEILFNSSYRKILDTTPFNYKFYKEYVINLDFIEETLTELMLKNKKLLDENITEFVYNDEVFNNQVNNSMTLLREKYITSITLYDKVTIYKFCEGNKNIHLYKNIINDFVTLMKLLNSKNKENEVKGESKIYEVLNDLKDTISKEFIKLFEQQNELTIGKLPEIFDYYLRVIFEEVNKEMRKYQTNLDKSSKDLINNFYKDKQLINKKDYAYAIRLFITLILLPEEDKNKKIKINTNNIMKYLKSPDFWTKDILNDDKFNKNFNELKSMNFKINQIIYLYEALGKDIEKNFFEDVIRKIKEEKEKDKGKKNEESEEEEEEEEEEDKRDDDDDPEGIRD